MKREKVIGRTETLRGQKSKQVASCSWIYYLVIATTTNLLITFICQSSGHKSESHHAWCFTYIGQWYGPWPGDLTCRARHNRWMGGSRAEGTVAPSRLLCSLAWCQTWACGVEQLVPVGTKPKQQQVFPLCLHFCTEGAGRLPGLDRKMHYVPV